MMFRNGRACVLSLVLASLPPAVTAQPAPPAAASAAADQALVDDVMAAVNARDPAVRADFLARRVAANPRMPRSEFPVVLEQIARTGGGLTIQSWTRRGRLRILVKNPAGRVGRIDLGTDEQDPTKLSGLIAVATPTPYAAAPQAPLPPGELAAAIDRRVRFATGRDEFSGVVLVMKGDEVVYRGAFGEADKTAHAPNSLDTRFNLGSMDKQFTAVAIGQLIEQGRLGLDTPLIDVLPDYPNREAARKITIRHLLSHSAGLGMLFERPGWQWKQDYRSMGEILPLFAAAPLEFEPGARSAYSNEGFVVLGAVIEKLTGQPWDRYVQTNVFDRAGMTHTGYLNDDPKVPLRATGYKFPEEDPLGFGVRQANWDSLSRRGTSCGGGYSTAGDMVKFLQALRAGRLLKPETLALFTAPSPGGLADYGLGFQRVAAPGGRTILGHDGGGPHSGINSDAKMIWETGYAYAVLGNYDAPYAQTLGRDIGSLLAAQN